MESSEPTQVVSVEILGTQFRVRAPQSHAKTVERAADLVQQRITKVKEQTDTPERTVMRAALQLAFEAMLAERGVQSRLDKLIHQLDAVSDD